MPLYKKLKFPANSMIVTTFLIKIATFDLIDTEFVEEEMWYFPDDDPYNL